MRMTRVFSFFILLTTLFLLASNFSHAQEIVPDKGISISPLKIEISGDPGETVEGEFKYFNATGSVVKMYFKTVNFEPSDNSGTPSFLLEEKVEYGTTLRDWIEVQPSMDVEQITPNRSIPTSLKFKVNIPANASPGGHYAAILAGLKPYSEKVDIEIGGTVVNQESAGLIILTVNGDIRYDSNIETLEVVDHYNNNKGPFNFFGFRFFEFTPVKFIATIKNDGNTHVRPIGNLFLFKGNKEIANFKFNEEGGAVLRESKRTFDVDTWGEDRFIYRVPKLDDKGSMITLHGKVETKLKVNWGGILKPAFGKYTGKLVAVYDNGEAKETITKSVSFWIIPWRFILLVLLIITVYLLYKKYQNKSTKKNSR